MISIRAPRKVAKPKPQSVAGKIRQWAATPTSCRGCGGVRKAVGGMAAKLSRTR